MNLKINILRNEPKELSFFVDNIPKAIILLEKEKRYINQQLTSSITSDLRYKKRKEQLIYSRKTIIKAIKEMKKVLNS